MTHEDTLEKMFNEQKIVRISEMRLWCDYRKRISNLRKKGLNIVPIKLEVPSLNRTVRAYKLIKKEEQLNLI